MKPIILLEAGLSLAISATGFIYACKIFARRRRSGSIMGEPPSFETKVSTQETVDIHELFIDEASISRSGPNSTSLCQAQHKDPTMASPRFLDSIGSLDIHDKANFQEELLQVRSRMQEFEDKILSFSHAMKEQQSLQIELRNMLLLETAGVKFLERKISSMEAEKQRSVNLAEDYLRNVKQLEYSKMQNGYLRRKVRKLLRTKKEKSRIIRVRNSRIKDQEAEILRCQDALETTRTNVIKKLEDEAKVMQTIVNRLQEEKKEPTMKLNSVYPASPISKVEADRMKLLATEKEQPRKDRETKIGEEMYMRWTSSCLRCELLMRLHGQEHHQIEQKSKHLDVELEGELEGFRFI